MSDVSSPGLRLDFGSLPLVEVAVRITFSQPLELKFATINHVAEKLQRDFPTLAEPQVFEIPPGISAQVELGPGTLVGAIYSGNPHGIIVTVQAQLVVARWLKQVQSNAPDYPRYPALRGALWQAIDALTEATNESPLPIAVSNMSYVNFLTMSPSEPVLATYFSELVHVRAVLHAQSLHKVEASWREPDDVDLRFMLEQVTAKDDVEGFRLTTAAGQRLAAEASPRDRLDALHTRLQAFFHDVLSEHAKKEWALTLPAVAQ